MHWIAAVILLAIASFFAWRSYNAAQTAKAAQSWPKVPGVVTVSRVEMDRDRDINRDGPVQTTYRAVVEYEYEAAGIKRTGSHIGIGDATQTSQGAAVKQAALYPVGKAIEVIVDPTKPDHASLTTKASLNLLFPVIFGAIGIVLLLVNF